MAGGREGSATGIGGNERRMTMIMLMKYSMPFVIIMLLSIVVGFMIYERTLHVLEQEANRTNRLLLEQGMGALDSRFQELDATIRKIGEDSSVARLQQIAEPFGSDSLYRVIETRNRLQEYAALNELVLDFFILYKNNELVLNDKFIARFGDFGDTLSYSPEEAELLPALKKSYYYKEMLPSKRAVLNGKAHNVLTYAHSFGFPMHSNGTMLFLLDEDEIRKLLGGLNIEGGWAYIADEEGRILTSLSGDDSGMTAPPHQPSESPGMASERLGDEDLIVTYVKSPYNGWTYAAAQPSQVVYDKIYYFRKTIYGALFLFLVAASLVAVYFAYRNSRPVQALLQTLSKYAPEPVKAGGNALGSIQVTVSKIIESNEQLQEKVNRQLPFLRASFFERLLRGQFSSEGDMEAAMRNLKVHWDDGDVFVVAVLSFPSGEGGARELRVERLNECKAVVSEYVQRGTQGPAYAHETDDDKMALIFNFPGGGTDEAIYKETAAKLECLLFDMEHMYGIAMSIAAGGISRRWTAISRSFLEAQQTLMGGRTRGVAWHKDMGPQRDGYSYPENMENRLIHLLRTGNVDELAELLDELHRQNFANRRLSFFVLKVFLFDFIGSVVKLSDETGMPGLELDSVGLTAVDSAGSIEEQFLLIKDRLLAMCRTVEQSKRTEQHRRFDEYIRYIDEHYADAQMSLALLADRFQVTETYLSRWFKEHTGFHFFEHVEHRRLERSKTLLSETGMAVGEIALTVGYSSANTFGRAFKRSVGVSAMAYRNQIMAESKN
ncbi:helix-turn-helix domain-containing protein [Paenibacillus arenilitoris]|uniref:AraC family transcriptional regulator n=1 Tax=Paenibacillus arenilitoris TaxID=2772299 RepID=A0A927CK44_9BACL|nr:helix-turn-helix domain-containing protein [Paenibacillus arenilitoris]MBD2869004.1 AraC family transcriptional regulator [Paenibacillus arenilitoris]